jgi:hypothetical protein
MQFQEKNIDYINNSHYDLIKNILLTTPTYVSKLPFKVDNYSKPIELWNKYKINKNISMDNHLIKSAFDFHLSNNNHVLLFYSTILDNCLLFCKIENKYYNIIVPFQGYSVLKNCNDSVIATYVQAY